MTEQLSLLDSPVVDIATIASPICCYEHCRRKGRAVLGPAVDLGGCINRSIHCLDCGARGEQSTRKDWEGAC